MLEYEDDLREVASWVGREDRVGPLLEMATSCLASELEPLAAPDDFLADAAAAAAQEAARAVPGTVLDLAQLVAPVDDEEPVISGRGLLRVARRFYGDEQILDRQNRLTDGRIAIARLIGGDANARDAHLGLVELAATVCVPGPPRCADCPLRSWCVEANHG